MNLIYVDTSAALRAILEAGTSPEIEQQLVEADVLVTSRLALVESARAFHRLRFLGELTEEQCDHFRAKAEELWAHCEIWQISPEICDLAASLEVDTLIRTLDALHLATFLRAREELPELRILLTADHRLREATELALG